MPEPHAQTGYETLFDPSRFDPSKAPIVNPDGTITPTPNYDPLNGLIRNGVNGIPNNFTNQHQWYFNSSIGFAWDVFGDSKTSLRGGYGITHSRVFTGSDCSKDCKLRCPVRRTDNSVQWHDGNPLCRRHPSSIERHDHAGPEHRARIRYGHLYLKRSRGGIGEGSDRAASVPSSTDR